MKYIHVDFARGEAESDFSDIPKDNAGFTARERAETP
jgi:hypothetical protein